MILRLTVCLAVVCVLTVVPQTAANSASADADSLVLNGRKNVPPKLNSLRAPFLSSNGLPATAQRSNAPSAVSVDSSDGLRTASAAAPPPSKTSLDGPGMQFQNVQNAALKRAVRASSANVPGFHSFSVTRSAQPSQQAPAQTPPTPAVTAPGPSTPSTRTASASSPSSVTDRRSFTFNPRSFASAGPGSGKRTRPPLKKLQNAKKKKKNKKNTTAAKPKPAASHPVVNGTKSANPLPTAKLNPASHAKNDSHKGTTASDHSGHKPKSNGASPTDPSSTSSNSAVSESSAKPKPPAHSAGGAKDASHAPRGHKTTKQSPASEHTKPSPVPHHPKSKPEESGEHAKQHLVTVMIPATGNGSHTPTLLESEEVEVEGSEDVEVLEESEYSEEKKKKQQEATQAREHPKPKPSPPAKNHSSSSDTKPKAEESVEQSPASPPTAPSAPASQTSSESKKDTSESSSKSNESSNKSALRSESTEDSTKKEETEPTASESSTKSSEQTERVEEQSEAGKGAESSKGPASAESTASSGSPSPSPEANATAPETNTSAEQSAELSKSESANPDEQTAPPPPAPESSDTSSEEASAAAKTGRTQSSETSASSEGSETTATESGSGSTNKEPPGPAAGSATTSNGSSSLPPSESAGSVPAPTPSPASPADPNEHANSPATLPPTKDPNGSDDDDEEDGYNVTATGSAPPTAGPSPLDAESSSPKQPAESGADTGANQPESSTGPSEPATPPPEPEPPSTPTPPPSKSTPTVELPPVPKLKLESSSDCSVSLRSADPTISWPSSPFQVHLLWETEGTFNEIHHTPIALTPNDLTRDEIMYWVLCDARKKSIERGLIPGVTYFFATRVCSADFTACSREPVEPAEGLSLSKLLVPDSNPADFGIRLKGNIKIGGDRYNLKSTLAKELGVDFDRIVQVDNPKSAVMFDIIPSSKGPTCSEVADRLRLSHVLAFESMHIIRRCENGPLAKFAEICEAPPTVWMSSDNILYFGFFTFVAVGFCYYTRFRKTNRPGDKHGRFQKLGAVEEDELEMQSFDGAATKGSSAAKPSRQTNGTHSTSELASKEFRTIDVMDAAFAAAPNSQPGDHEDGSAVALMRRVLSNMGIPEIGMKRYIAILEEKWVHRVDQMRAYDNGDWKRLGLPEIIEQALREELKHPKTGSNGKQPAKGLSLAKKPAVAASTSTSTAPLSTGATPSKLSTSTPAKVTEANKKKDTAVAKDDKSKKQASKSSAIAVSLLDDGLDIDLTSPTNSSTKPPSAIAPPPAPSSSSTGRSPQVKPVSTASRPVLAASPNKPAATAHAPAPAVVLPVAVAASTSATALNLHDDDAWPTLDLDAPSAAPAHAQSAHTEKAKPSQHADETEWADADDFADFM